MRNKPVEYWRKRLKKFRNKQNLTQKQLAFKAHVSQGCISQLESGSRGKRESLTKIIEALDITYHDLFVRDELLTKDCDWTFSREVKGLYPDLRHVVETANKAADKQKTSYLISALKDVADEIEGIKKFKKVVGR